MSKLSSDYVIDGTLLSYQAQALEEFLMSPEVRNLRYSHYVVIGPECLTALHASTDSYVCVGVNYYYHGMEIKVDDSVAFWELRKREPLPKPDQPKAEIKQELGVTLRTSVGEIYISGLPTGKNVYWSVSNKELRIRIPLS